MQPNEESIMYPFGIENEKDFKFGKIKFMEWYDKKIRATFPEYDFRK